ncbi:hypothetical protein BDZ89DRAFT_1215529 [Hymenopellis radicata]|nr:hypothetical protein BDZ89DRAFT_1215529 [Hymenopellis radicata]
MMTGGKMSMSAPLFNSIGAPTGNYDAVAYWRCSDVGMRCVDVAEGKLITARTSQESKRARPPASPSSPSLSKARKEAVLPAGSPRKRKFEDEALNDEELGLKVVSVMALSACPEFRKGEESRGKMSRQVKKKDKTRLPETNEGEPQEMDPCTSLPMMQEAFDLGPIMSPRDSMSIDSTVPNTLEYFDWDELLRAESPDLLDIISNEGVNGLASDDDLDPLEIIGTSTMRQRLEQITTVYLAKATLDKIISDAETGHIEPTEALKELRRVSNMLAGQLDEFGDD